MTPKTRNPKFINTVSKLWQANSIPPPHPPAVLKALVAEHVAETKSPLGARLLNDWDREVGHFWQVVPKEMLTRLPQPLTVAQEKRA